MSCPSAPMISAERGREHEAGGPRDGGVQLGDEGGAVASVENLEGIDDGDLAPSRDVDMARAVHGDPAAVTGGEERRVDRRAHRIQLAHERPPLPLHDRLDGIGSGREIGRACPPRDVGIAGGVEGDVPNRNSLSLAAAETGRIDAVRTPLN